jgi:hypothetical protein
MIATQLLPPTALLRPALAALRHHRIALHCIALLVAYCRAQLLCAHAPHRQRCCCRTAHCCCRPSCLAHWLGGLGVGVLLALVTRAPPAPPRTLCAATQAIGARDFCSALAAMAAGRECSRCRTLCLPLARVWWACASTRASALRRPLVCVALWPAAAAASARAGTLSCGTMPPSITLLACHFRRWLGCCSVKHVDTRRLRHCGTATRVAGTCVRV